MPNDFEQRQNKIILDQIEDPYQKDLTYVTLTVKDCFNQVIVSATTAACFGACAALLEAGDHLAALVCYAGCSAYAGFICYRGFRKTWQNFSIPIKSYILSFFIS